MPCANSPIAGVAEIGIEYSEIDMNYLEIVNEARTREEWIKMVDLPENMKNSVLSADILIVPSLMPKQPMAFMSGTTNLFAYLQSQVGESVEICIDEEKYVEIELNSRKIRLGKFNIKELALTLFLNILGGYIANQCNRPAVPETVIEAREFQKPVEVEFSITVEDSTGRRKEFKYDGPAADYKEVSDEILIMWNEE